MSKFAELCFRKDPYGIPPNQVVLESVFVPRTDLSGLTPEVAACLGDLTHAWCDWRTTYHGDLRRRDRNGDDGGFTMTRDPPTESDGAGAGFKRVEFACGTVVTFIIP